TRRGEQRHRGARLMGEVITNEEQHAGGEAGIIFEGEGDRRRRRARPVDFSRPTKFSNDQEHRIARALEGFCASAATRLSAELREAVELEVINVSQLLWSSATQQLPADSLGATTMVKPLGTRMLLTTELSFVLTAMEFLVGGKPERMPLPRRMSEIDW